MLKLGEKEALKGKMCSKSPACVSSVVGLQVGLLHLDYTYGYPQAHTSYPLNSSSSLRTKLVKT